jgi:hypothetical protein
MLKLSTGRARRAWLILFLFALWTGVLASTAPAQSIGNDSLSLQGVKGNEGVAAAPDTTRREIAASRKALRETKERRLMFALHGDFHSDRSGFTTRLAAAMTATRQ